MKEFEYVIRDELGLHARPAGLLVRLCSQFACDVSIRCGNARADAKRIMSVMLLAAKKGQTITVCCSGADEVQAEEKILALFASENL